LRAASATAGLERLSSRLDELKAWLGPDLAVVGAELDALSRPRTGDLAERAAAHLIGQRGKRIRPICVLLGAEVAGAPGDSRAVDLAVACELVHAATLLHDDVIDEGEERRGVPAARVVFGNSASILAGDYLLIEALERVQRVGSGTLLTELFATIAQMVAAEAWQLERRGTLDPSRELYLRIVDGKTASLFRWALCAGASLGCLSQEQHAALAAAGIALGRAFQLIDDALDLDADPSELDKDLFADLQQGKLSWPLLVAAECDTEVRAALTVLARGERVTSAELARVVDRVRRAGGVSAARRFAEAEAQAAKRALSSLPAGQARDALVGVIEATVSRRS
jgi:octaprenyl-diphosphate synthase